ncbi:MAG: GDSL-type esterase/lipase family protein [Gammaproteobacteria bacterium]
MKRTRNAAAASARQRAVAAGIAFVLAFFAVPVTAAEAVANSQPQIASNPPVAAQVGVELTYDVQATDADSRDTLTYSLDTAPATMSIDAATGRIEWTPMSGDEGATPVVVRVQDDGSQAQSTTQSFDVFVVTAESTEPSLLYFSTKANTAIPGVPGPYDDADIYRLDPGTGAYDKFFDARDAGLPGNADIDAFSVVDSDTFYISFARGAGTNVPGLGNVSRSDVVLYDGGTFQPFLDGSDVGLGETFAENIDAIHVESASAILISTGGKPSIGVSGANKEDILRCEGSFGATTNCSWSLYFDGSANSLRGRDENIDAFYELDNDLYISTRGPFAVPGVSGQNNDVLRCASTQSGGPKTCSSFHLFLEGDFYALPDDVDAIDFASGAVSEPPPDDLFRVVILGSSTARGAGASAWRNAWARLLNTWLRQNTAEHEVVNLADGGQTTEDVRPDGSSPPPNPDRNISRALELDPDIVLINLPSNNVAEGIPIATTISHYQEIVDEAAQQGVPVYMTTTQPRNFTDSAQRHLLQDEANAVRAQFGTSVIDIYDELTDFGNDLRIKPIYDSGDGTHLNDAGHNYIFETVRDKIEPLVLP